MQDVIIVGGGVVGLSVAWELAGQGLAVGVIEQGRFGHEASWAGAGILPPGNPEKAQGAEAQLRSMSHVLWPEQSEQLREETGIDNGYRVCGGLELRLQKGEDLEAEMQTWIDGGVEVERLTSEQLEELEPKVNHRAVCSYRLPELGQVRNPRHLKALQSACVQRGVDLMSGTPVVGVEKEGDRIVAVRTPTETWPAGRFCITSGAWSRGLLEQVGCRIAIEPVRGQIVLLSQPTPTFGHVLNHGPRYLVPRPDGRILVGSTEELVGFNRQTTAAGVAGLIEFAVQLVPSLAMAEVERSWAGLRPGSADGLPYLGRVSDFENLFVATGHFRNGLQMSPGTAVIMRQLMLEEEPSINLDEFACNRHASSSFQPAWF